jgi:hypothetical protein
MATELAVYSSDRHSLSAPPPSAPSPIGRRHYQQLFEGGFTSRCFEKTKECVSDWYGEPYSGLTNRQAAGKYCKGATLCSIGILWAACATLITVVSVENDGSAHDPILVPFQTTAASIVNCVALSTIAAGAKKVYKTCKAPRLAEEDAVLP